MKKYIFTSALVLTLVLIGSYKVVEANPSFFIRANSSTCGSLVATTSPTYMTAGTATTTYVFDTGCAGAGSVDGAVLLTQYVASSTSGSMSLAFSYSQDGIDYYSDTLSAGATTTQTINKNTVTSYILTGVGNKSSGAAGTASTTYRSITVPTPTKYVRAVFTVPSESVNGAIWAEFVAKRQAN